MRPLAQGFPGRVRRGPLFAFGFFVFAMVAAYEVAGYIISNDVSSLAFVGLAFVGGAFVVAMLNDWRHGLYFFLAWLLFEDLARKFLGNNMAIYFAKDFLAAVVYLSFFVAYRRKEKGLQTIRPPFLVALLSSRVVRRDADVQSCLDQHFLRPLGNEAVFLLHAAVRGWLCAD